MNQVRDAYNRFDPANKVEALIYRDNKPAQASEHNEAHSVIRHRMKGISDALFKDGDIIKGAQVLVKPETGEVSAAAGGIYLNGAVRTLEAKNFTIPIDGSVGIGVRLISVIISELEDPRLLNPAVGSATYGLPGACRLKITPEWGFEGDGGEGNFYVVYVVDDGVLRHKEAPPNLDSFNQGIALYDRDSTGGGKYIVDGLIVRVAESNGDRQQYTVTEGRAHVYGYSVTLPTSRRIGYSAVPDLRTIPTEFHTANGDAVQRINVAQAPIREVLNVSVTLQKTVSIVHGAYSSAPDTLPDTAIVSILECKQGETIYVVGDDYVRTGDTVNWSPSGAEPGPGSTYECTYTYASEYIPAEQDFDGFNVAGAVEGSTIVVGYTQSLPRLDILCLTQEGLLIWQKGIASNNSLKLPTAPDDVLPIATIHQTWREQSTIENDGLRVMSFATLEAINRRVDFVMKEVSRNRLESDISARESGVRVGIFVDDFEDDSTRDQGIKQTAATVNGILTLPISAEVKSLPVTFSVPATLPYTPSVTLEQTARTGSSRVNPYDSFSIPPALATINPAVDRWSETQTTWTSSVTQRFSVSRDGGFAISLGSTTASNTQVVSSQTTVLEYLRQIAIDFSLSGFGAGEVLKSVIFDGIDVEFTPKNLVANNKGELSGSFIIPAKVPAGAKTVTFEGSATRGTSSFVGQGNLTTTTLRQVNSVTTTFWDPLAQTFMLERNTQICGVDLWFTAKAEDADVRVQIRTMASGVPTTTVIAESLLDVKNIVVTGNGHTRVNFPVLVQLLAATQYAIVILCNDAITSLAIAEMGEFDSHTQKWVGSQPYTVGVLLSSSNSLTWDAHQTEDLTFRLLEAKFSSDTRTIEMGTVAVEAATDLILLALDEAPTADAQIEYELTLPDDKNTQLRIAQGQPVRLDEPMTGNVGVCAKLRGTQAAAPLLWPNAQMLTGKVALSGDYYSISIPAKGAKKATLIYNAFVPFGATVMPEVQVDNGDWLGLTAKEAIPQGDGVVEYTLTCVLADANLIKLRLTLTGTASARPFVSKLRLTAIE